ncbi:bifunctional 3'-5' exonuclease/DNA polymerase, partial [Microbacterium arthrosphaerae]
MDADEAPAWVVLGRAAAAGAIAVALDSTAHEIARHEVADAALTSWIGDAERRWSPRWVWHDTPQWYGGLLSAGVRIARCHDLRLCHAILRDSVLVGAAAAVRSAEEWDAAAHADAQATAPALFELDETGGASGPPADVDAALAEFRRQREAIAASSAPGRLRLLTAAESAGALVAAEMRAAG